MPALSICIPVFNAAPFIGATISSVLAQTFTDFEVIVVDDASTDGSADIVAAFGDSRIRLVRQAQNRGAAATWNRALDSATGRYAKLVCHDDTLAPGCLASQVATLDAHPGVAFCAGRRDIVDEHGRVLLPARGLTGLAGVVRSRDAIRATIRSGTNTFGEPAAVMLRQSLLARCGPFDATRPYVIDLDYWCRMLRLGDLYAAEETVAAFRVVQTSWSVRMAGAQCAQVVGLFRDLRAGDPDGVSRSDLLLGAARARALMYGRGLSYRLMARGRRGGRQCVKP